MQINFNCKYAYELSASVSNYIFCEIDNGLCMSINNCRKKKDSELFRQIYKGKNKNLTLEKFDKIVKEIECQ